MPLHPAFLLGRTQGNENKVRPAPANGTADGIQLSSILLKAQPRTAGSSDGQAWKPSLQLLGRQLR
ncbi:MAG TPA: hypothetical protein VE734_03290 [Terriglobales bacterium]|nr:hypothetical protein [Terriglobales bacterium]